MQTKGIVMQTKGIVMQTKSWCGFTEINPGSHVGSRSSKEDTGNKGKRTLLCKPSRDVDSRKTFQAVMLNQGSAEKTQEKKGIVIETGQIYTETGFWACQKRIAQKKRKEKENC